jgi:hypothetical protein
MMKPTDTHTSDQNINTFLLRFMLTYSSNLVFCYGLLSHTMSHYNIATSLQYHIKIATFMSDNCTYVLLMECNISCSDGGNCNAYKRRYKAVSMILLRECPKVCNGFAMILPLVCNCSTGVDHMCYLCNVSQCQFFMHFVLNSQNGFCS